MALMDFLEVKKEDRGTVWKVYFLFLSSGLMATIFGSVLPYLKAEYGISYAFAGFLSSTRVAGNISGVLLAGFLPMLMGRKKCILTLGVGLWLSLLIVIATGNPVFLVIAYLMSGIGKGSTSIANTLIGEKAGKPGAGLNILHAVASLGSVISPILVAMTSSIGWRTACVAVGLLSFISLFGISRSNIEDKASTKEKWTMPRGWVFWLTACIAFCYNAYETCIVHFLTSFTLESGLLPEKIAIMSQSLLWAAMLLGRILCARFSASFNRSRMVLILGAGTLISTILLFSVHSVVLAVISVILMGLSMSGIFPTNISTIPKAYRGIGTVTSIYIAFANVGGITMTNVLGNAADKWGLASAYRIILIPLALMVILMAIKALFAGKGEN